MTLRLHPTRVHPTLIDRLEDALAAIDRVTDIDCICIDPDPEMTALLAEPVPALTVADICRDERE